jgi:hypothetical protein
MIEGLKIKQTFAQNELQDGDVLTYQVEISPEQYVITSSAKRYTNGQISRPVGAVFVCQCTSILRFPAKPSSRQLPAST